VHHIQRLEELLGGDAGGLDRHAELVEALVDGAEVLAVDLRQHAWAYVSTACGKS
jgi:hypothetical protein